MGRACGTIVCSYRSQNFSFLPFSQLLISFQIRLFKNYSNTGYLNEESTKCYDVLWSGEQCLRSSILEHFRLVWTRKSLDGGRCFWMSYRWTSMIFVGFISSVKHNWNIDNMRTVSFTDRSILTGFAFNTTWYTSYWFFLTRSNKFWVEAWV